jgi:hypothetical protein
MYISIPAKILSHDIEKKREQSTYVPSSTSEHPISETVQIAKPKKHKIGIIKQCDFYGL